MCWHREYGSIGVWVLNVINGGRGVVMGRVRVEQAVILHVEDLQALAHDAANKVTA
jgi:hypothetical protein